MLPGCSTLIKFEDTINKLIISENSIIMLAFTLAVRTRLLRIFYIFNWGFPERTNTSKLRRNVLKT